MTKDDNRSAAGLRRSAIAERLRIREEWSALKEIEKNTLKDSSNKNNTNTKQQPASNFVIRFPLTGSKNRNVFKTPTPKSKLDHNISEALRGLVVHVDVGSASKALALRAALTALGGTVSPVWSNLVTHLVWSDGGCRKIRSKARLLACKLVSPLWVEACASAGKRLPEGLFPAASRPSDLPSPNTLKLMLKKLEQENIPLELLVEDQGSEKNKAPRLRISSDTDTNTSHNTTGDKSKSTSKIINEPDIQVRVNTAPRRALPMSTTPERPIKSKRRLFTQKEAEIQAQTDDGTDEDLTPAKIKTTHKKLTQKKKQLNRDLVRKIVGNTKANHQKLKATQSSDKRPRIVLTGMSRQERHEIIKSIKHLNGKIQSTVNKKTTHILLGTCGPYRTNKTYCSKCDSPEKILSQMFKTNLAVHDKRRKEDVLCKCTSLMNKNDNNGQNIDLNTSLLDQGRDSQDICSSIETIVKNNKPRTLNALLGAVRGCRILYSKWVLDSLKVNRWVHHFGYEVKHLKKISEKARFERSALQKMHSEYTYNVFNETKIQISQNAEQKDAVTQLLTVCGADIQNGGSDTDITIGRENGEICSKWVFDSIAAGRLRTTRRYINRNMPVDVVDLN